MSKREFVWGESPVVFVTNMHHYLNCPVWYEDIGELRENSYHESLGLDPIYRTARLKRYQTFDSMARGAWRAYNIVWILGHMITVPESRLYISDGYPKQYLNTARLQVDRCYEQMFKEDIPLSIFKNIKVRTIDTYQHYKNALTEYHALADEYEFAYLELAGYSMASAIPELKAVEEIFNPAPVNTGAMTEEEIENLANVHNILGDDPPEGDGGIGGAH